MFKIHGWIFLNWDESKLLSTTWMSIKTCFSTCSIPFPASWCAEVQESSVVFFQHVTLSVSLPCKAKDTSFGTQSDGTTFRKALCCHQSEFYSYLRCCSSSVLWTRAGRRTEISVCKYESDRGPGKSSDTGEEKEDGRAHKAHRRRE